MMLREISTTKGWAPEERVASGLPDIAPLFPLLRYVRAHRKHAALTALFGTVGFLLSFVYPWIIGSVVDLVVAPASVDLELRRRKLVWLTELAALTGVMHAV